jgi:hypothetical protein
MIPVLILAVVAGHPLASSNLTGPEVLNRCQRAYARLRTLDETVTATQSNARGSAHIRFKRPGMLVVTGMTLLGSPYELLCTGGSTSIFNSGRWTPAGSPEMGLAMAASLSGGAAMMVPAALLHTAWGALNASGGSVRLAKESLGRRKTYRIETSSPLSGTLWIDAKTYLIVKSAVNLTGKPTVITFGPAVVDRPIASSAFKH